MIDAAIIITPMLSNDNNSGALSEDQLLLSLSSSAPPPPERRNLNMMHLPNEADAAEEVSADEVAIIFSFLSHADIMRLEYAKHGEMPQRRL